MFSFNCTLTNIIISTYKVVSLYRDLCISRRREGLFIKYHNFMYPRDSCQQIRRVAGTFRTRKETNSLIRVREEVRAKGQISSVPEVSGNLRCQHHCVYKWRREVAALIIGTLARYTGVGDHLVNFRLLACRLLISPV